MLRLTTKKIADLKPKAARYMVGDPECPGLFVRVYPSGTKSFWIIVRDPWKKQVWCEVAGATVGVDELEDVRTKAREGIKRLKAGKEAFPPPPAKPDTFKAVAEDYVKRHVVANKLRSKDEIERCLKTYVYPVWQDRVFTEIRKGDVTKLLDAIEDDNGARQADAVLAIVRGLMNWYEARNDGYDSPVVRRMARTRPAERARSRTLADDEIRLIWPLLADRSGFGAICKLALLTGQRREKIASMRWRDVSEGVWTIATEAREKGNAGTLTLPKMALDLIEAQPKIVGNKFVFAGRGDNHFDGFSKAKVALDGKVLERLQALAEERGELPAKTKPLPRWTIHDLRRTSKVLMMRAGVDRFHAERVLGHRIAGVEGVYDRHDYGAERKAALAALAGIVELILKPPGGNVVQGRFKQAAE